MSSSDSPNPRSRKVFISIVLAVLVFAVFGQTVGFQFVAYDDDGLVYENPHVAEGLTASSLKWAFTGRSDYWDPVPRISHMLIYQCCGNNPMVHHLLNVTLHAVSAILLFHLLVELAGAVWPAALISAVFAIHPFQVEAVAWVTQRGTLLCTAFWLLSLNEWARYVVSSQRRHYWLSLLCFVFALCSKPVAMTMPAVLLILEFWPFRRRLSVALLKEKVPFLLLSVCGAATALVTQSALAAVETLDRCPPALRAANVITTYAILLIQFLWPANLAVIHPYPKAIPFLSVIGAGILLVFISAALGRLRRTKPELLFGWVWFLVVLIPMVGIVQVGGRARTDHSMYVPIVGLAWIVTSLGATWFNRKKVLALAGAVIWVAVMASVSFVQAASWRDTPSLFNRAIQVHPENVLAYENLGDFYLVQGRLPEAETAYRKSLALGGPQVRLRTSLSKVLAAEKRFLEAVEECQKALKLDTENEATLRALGTALTALPGREKDARSAFLAAATVNPDSELNRMLLGVALIRAGEPDAGLNWLQPLLDSQKNSFSVQYEAGRAMLLHPETLEDGVRHLQRAVTLVPGSADAQNALGAALLMVPRLADQAIPHLIKAVQLKPDLVRAHTNLGTALVREKRYEDAIVEYRQSILLDPRYATAHAGLASVYEKLEGHKKEALAEYQAAFRLQASVAWAEKIRSMGGTIPTSN